MRAAIPDWVWSDLAHAVVIRAERLGGVLDTGELANQLYTYWYSAPAVGATADSDPQIVFDIAEELRAAHADTAVFEDGWTVHDIGRIDSVSVERRGEQRIVEPVDIIAPGRIGTMPRPGETVRVCRRRDRVEDHYWLTWSAPPNDPKTPEVRVYWNVPLDAAASLVCVLTAFLSTTDLPWSLKLPHQNWGYERADAAVLYLGRPEFAAIRPGLLDVHREVGDRLRPAVPRLTRRLRPGLGVAEDPANQQSFGEHRCGLIAEALIGQPVDSPVEAQVEAIAVVMRRNGVDPGLPHICSAEK